MAVSINSVFSFNPLLQARYQLLRTANTKTLPLKLPSITSPSSTIGSRNFQNGKRSRFHLLVTEGDQVATATDENDSKTLEEPYSNNRSSSNPTFEKSSATEDKAQPVDEPGSTAQISEDSSSSLGSKNLNQDTSESKSSSTIKKSPLTARERLRAARVLNRYTDTKPSKPELGSKLLEALQETDKGKKRRPGLPQAPTNLFDDSKRGLPKEGWTINIIPGGMDVFLIIFSFVFISSVMFATTYIVWKVGAIHFNEY